LDADEKFAHGIEGFFRHEVAVVDFSRLLAGVNLHPGDLAPAAVGLFDRRIPDALAGRHDVRADTVAFDEGDDRVVRHVQLAVRGRNLLAVAWHDDLIVRHVSHSPEGVTELGGWRMRGL